jgi:hypothetical protein
MHHVGMSTRLRIPPSFCSYPTIHTIKCTQVYTANPDLPFHVIVSSALVPGTKALYYPCEHTPLYSGVPVRVGSDPEYGPGESLKLLISYQLIMQ